MPRMEHASANEFAKGGFHRSVMVRTRNEEKGIGRL